MNRPLDRSDDPAPVQIPLTGILQSSRRISIASPCSDTMALASDVDRYRRASAILDILRRLDHANLDEVIVMGRALARLEVIRANSDITIEAPTWSALDEALRLEMTDVRLEREHAAAVAEDAARDVERQIAGLVGTSVNTTAVDNPQMLSPADAEIVDGLVVEEHIADLASRIAAAGDRPSAVEVNPALVDAALSAGLDVEIVGPCECQPSAPGAPYDPAPCGAPDCFIVPSGGEG